MDAHWHFVANTTKGNTVWVTVEGLTNRPLWTMTRQGDAPSPGFISGYYGLPSMLQLKGDSLANWLQQPCTSPPSVKRSA